MDGLLRSFVCRVGRQRVLKVLPLSSLGLTGEATAFVLLGTRVGARGAAHALEYFQVVFWVHLYIHFLG